VNETEAKALAAKQALERELERKRVQRAYAAIPDLVLEDIDREGFVGRALAGPGEIDPYRMAMNEGARVLALRIREKVRLGKEADKDTQTKAVSETARGDS
jgi:hypothetical protein